MINLRESLVVIVIILVLVGCTPPQSVAELPTRAVLPSPTPSDIPSSTPTPTPTASPTPSATPTPTASPTHTPTDAPTNTPRATATFTLSPTFTLTPSDTPTLTPTAPAQPEIINFQSNVAQATPGDTFVLRWQIDAETARIDRLNATGTVVETIPITPEQLIGSRQFTVPQTNEASLLYRLVAIRGGEEIRATVSIRLTPACEFDWFFANPPQGINCPLDAPTTGTLSFQRFQGGFMFRLRIGAVDAICGLQTARSTYTCTDYRAYTETPPVTPPGGLFEPGSDVEYAFYRTNGQGGPWYLDTVLGWGIEDIQPASSVSVQYGNNEKLYVQLPIGIYAFDDDLSGTFAPQEPINQSAN